MATATQPGDPMTDRQRAVFAFLVAWRREKGYGPTCDDIGAAFGYHSRNSAHGHLRALKKKGMIRWEPKKSRSVTVVGDDGDDRESLREAIRLVLDRLQPVPSAEPDEGTIGYSGYFSRAEVDHLKALAGEGGS